MMRSLLLTVGLLMTVPAVFAAGTPLDEFGDSVEKKARKAICVCQDGGAQHTGAGVLRSSEVCASGFCTVSTVCDIQLFNSTTFESAGTLACSTYETIAK
jgi:hypothetical protein